MRAARLHEWGVGAKIEDVPDPVPPAHGEAVVEMEAAAVTHLDLTLMSGTFAYRPALPFTPGTSGVGTVVAGDDTWRGRRVLVRGGGIGLERDGTWAQHVTVPVTALREVPAKADAPLTATCYSPLTTAWAAVEVVGKIRSGERVVVTGASGAVGSMCVQMAARVGAHVTAVVSREARTAAVPEAADEILVGWNEDTVTRIKEAGGADVLLDPVGGDTVPVFLPALNPGARAVLIGYVRGKTLTVDLPSLFAADVRLLPVSMVRQPVPDATFSALLTDLTESRLRLNATAFPFDRLADAIEARRTGGSTGTVAVTL
ncbi:zinc-binding dehydrogenase [Streptomyces sp. NPDC002896]|uniref:quinone oxidoreductase family protein n=1 Tax=Streptomyces sp. NPDC002896 TaxID=3154438 RepID=UPI00331C93F9